MNERLNDLVTWPVDELEGRLIHPDGETYRPPGGLSLSVGSVHPGRVLLTLATRTPVAEVELAPADALEVAARLLAMVAHLHPHLRSGCAGGGPSSSTNERDA